jgi:hypothetical protein
VRAHGCSRDDQHAILGATPSTNLAPDSRGGASQRGSNLVTIWWGGCFRRTSSCTGRVSADRCRSAVRRLLLTRRPSESHKRP